MPFNEIHLPLLRMAFPEAKIIRVVRHPLDVCVSMLANNMTHGFACAYRIEDIAHHLAGVFDLVEHYSRECNPGDFTLRYESLIADQSGETRRLLEYLGLPFEDACLRFHENRRYAPTPSYARVGRAAQRQLDQPPPPLRAAPAALSPAAGAHDDEVWLPLTDQARCAWSAQRPRPLSAPATSEAELHARVIDAAVVVDRARM